MATENQYKAFKEIYGEDARRYTDLGTRANLYLTIITFYLGVIPLKIDDLLKFVNKFGILVTRSSLHLQPLRSTWLEDLDE